MPLYKPFRHFAALVFLIFMFVATLPAWAKGHLLWYDLLYIVPMVSITVWVLPFFKLWSRTELYWQFHLSPWADLIGMLVSLVVLTGEIYGAWWLSGLSWFHLPSLEHLIFLLAMVLLSILWLTESITTLILTSYTARQILRSPFTLRRVLHSPLPLKRGEQHE